MQKYYKHLSARFFDRRSKTLSLVILKKFIIDAMEDHSQIDVVNNDSSKAFDSVNRAILLNKLRTLGFGRDILLWIKSYFSGRFQFVQMKGFASAMINVPSGVPQGSHLGSFLFNSFISDLPEQLLHSSILKYADNAKIYKKILSPEDAVHFFYKKPYKYYNKVSLYF